MKTITNGRISEKPSDKGFNKGKAAEISVANEFQYDAEGRLNRRVNYDEEMKKVVYMHQGLFIGEYPIDDFSQTGWMLLFHLYGAKVSEPKMISIVRSNLNRSHRCSDNEFQKAIQELSRSGLVEVKTTNGMTTINYVTVDGRMYPFKEDAYKSIVALGWVPVILITLYCFYTFTLEDFWIVDTDKIRILDGQVYTSRLLYDLFENSEMSVDKALTLMFLFGGTSFINTYIDKYEIIPGYTKCKVNLFEEPQNDYAVVLHPGIKAKDLDVGYKDRLIRFDECPFYK